MNYFNKIEAYYTNELSELECLVFEQELAESTTLQKEVAAYEMAQSLFGFTAETLPEEEIVDSEATAIADAIIGFAANNLSEDQILAEHPQTGKTTLIRQLQPRKNRTAWLAAASVAIVLSVIGLQIQNNQDSVTSLGPNAPIAVTKSQEKVVPKAVKTISPIIVKEESLEIVASSNTTQKATKSYKVNPKKYKPAKVKIVKKSSGTINNLASVIPKTKLTNPLALNTVAEKITTGTVIDKGQVVVYQAEGVITLKEGFHAKSGSSFLAMSNSTQSTNADFTSDEMISGTEEVVYQANQSITLKPGFHVKAGTGFKAETKSSDNQKEVAMNTIISANEEFVLKAGSSITLKPGFHAKAGADFTAAVVK